MLKKYFNPYAVELQFSLDFRIVSKNTGTLNKEFLSFSVPKIFFSDSRPGIRTLTNFE